MKLKFVSLVILLLSVSLPSYGQEGVTKVLPFRYEEVWRGLLLAMANYPLKNSNQDSGDIETRELSPGEVWLAPYDQEDEKRSYSLSIKIVKGRAGRRPATEVTILKNQRIRTNLMGASKELPSDLIEEQVLLYRVIREIMIELTIKKRARSSRN